MERLYHVTQVAIAFVKVLKLDYSHAAHRSTLLLLLSHYS